MLSCQLSSIDDAKKLVNLCFFRGKRGISGAFLAICPNIFYEDVF